MKEEFQVLGYYNGTNGISGKTAVLTFCISFACHAVLIGVLFILPGYGKPVINHDYSAINVSLVSIPSNPPGRPGGLTPAERIAPYPVEQKRPAHNDRRDSVDRGEELQRVVLEENKGETAGPTERLAAGIEDSGYPVRTGGGYVNDEKTASGSWQNARFSGNYDFKGNLQKTSGGISLPPVSGIAVKEAVPLYKENPSPVYPPQAKKRGHEGTVILEIMVTKEGRAVKVSVFQSSRYPLLDQAAVSSVEKWRFEPGKRGDKKVDMQVKIPIRFQLEED